MLYEKDITVGSKNKKCMKNKLIFKFSPFLILPILAGLFLVGLTIFAVESVWINAGIIITVSTLLGLRLEFLRGQGVDSVDTSSEAVQSVASNEDTAIDSMKDLSEVINQVIEVSNRQIESSRQQTEEAITTMSIRFSSLVGRLNSALEAATLSNAAVPAVDGSDSTLLDNVFMNSRGQLSDVIGNLAEALVNRQASFEHLKELAEDTAILKSMAEGVEKIASQTNLLALNAAIEAARAGEEIGRAHV